MFEESQGQLDSKHMPHGFVHISLLHYARLYQLNQMIVIQAAGPYPCNTSNKPLRAAVVPSVAMRVPLIAHRRPVADHQTSKSPFFPEDLLEGDELAMTAPVSELRRYEGCGTGLHSRMKRGQIELPLKCVQRFQ